MDVDRTKEHKDIKYKKRSTQNDISMQLKEANY